MSEIKKILIANRGEIASRIIRTCRKMGIPAIAVFSDVDRQALFVEEADQAVALNGNEPQSTYLDQDKIIAAAKKTAANAIHPGYGFLSENAAFAERCRKEGLIFIGPNSKAIELMGSKQAAKILMRKHEVPTIPGYDEDDQRPATLIAAAQKIGFPLLLKASAGGGGKGMRIVKKADELPAAIEAAQREAQSAFGTDHLIIEKYIEGGRHIEFQIFGDQQGNVIHLLERECSIQRRYQKVLEESPSPIMTDELRTAMASAALKAAKALQYDNAGTVEFIYDEKSNEFYFLEVNTRLQVEHPVTEMITGLDLVQMQIESASGQALAIQQAEVKGKGYAIELRLYAEDPAHQFLPQTGKIEQFSWPQVDGLRVESSIQNQSEVSIYYDPMLAKLIVWDQNRVGAHRKMRYVLQQMVCLGLKTNQSFLLSLLEQPAIQQGQYDTRFIEQSFDLQQLDQTTDEQVQINLIAATLFDWYHRQKERQLLKALPSGWRNNFYRGQQSTFVLGETEHTLNYRFTKDQFEISIDEKVRQARINKCSARDLLLEVDGLQYPFAIVKTGLDFFLHNESLGSIKLQQKERFPSKKTEQVAGGLTAPMPSQVIKILVKEGQAVSMGESLLVLSSMKMENTIAADCDGIVESIFVQEGENVKSGFLLLKVSQN